MADLGEIAYNAYREKRFGKTVSGHEMWTWAEMEQATPEVAHAWSAAAEAVVAALHQLGGE